MPSSHSPQSRNTPSPYWLKPYQVETESMVPSNAGICSRNSNLSDQSSREHSATAPSPSQHSNVAMAKIPHSAHCDYCARFVYVATALEGPAPHAFPDHNGPALPSCRNSTLTNISSGTRSSCPSFGHVDAVLEDTPFTTMSNSKEPDQLASPPLLPPRISMIYPYAWCPDFRRPELYDHLFNPERIYYPRFSASGWFEDERALRGQLCPFSVYLVRLPPPEYSWEDDEESAEYRQVVVFTIECALGDGAQGDVFLLKAEDTSYPLQEMVMKVSRIPYSPSGIPPAETCVEVAIARWLADERAPERYKSVFPKFHALRALNRGLEHACFMEYMPCGDLRHVLSRTSQEDKYIARPRHRYIEDTLNDSDPISGAQWKSNSNATATKWNSGDLQTRLLMCLDLLMKIDTMNECLSHMFEQEVFHPDLKPANILVDNHGGLRIADFGFMSTWDGVLGGTQHPPGTEEYQEASLIAKAGYLDCGLEPWKRMIRENEKWLWKRVSEPPKRDLVMWTIGTILTMELDLAEFLENNLPYCWPINPYAPIHRVTIILQKCFEEPGKRATVPELIENFTSLLYPQQSIREALTSGVEPQNSGLLRGHTIRRQDAVPSGWQADVHANDELDPFHSGENGIGEVPIGTLRREVEANILHDDAGVKCVRRVPTAERKPLFSTSGQRDFPDIPFVDHEPESEILRESVELDILYNHDYNANVDRNLKRNTPPSPEREIGRRGSWDKVKQTVLKKARRYLTGMKKKKKRKTRSSLQEEADPPPLGGYQLQLVN
ncbi:hypothetical protein IAT40_000663 [Kwoniella sp. CBS 6097]